MSDKVIKLIKEKGLFLEKSIFDLVSEIGDEIKVQEFLEQIERISGQKFITKNVLTKNVEYVKSFVGNLPGNEKNVLEKIFVNLGINLEVRRESELINDKKDNMNYKVFYSGSFFNKKIEVSDFVNHFRARFHQLQRILMARPELQKNLVSLGKISSERRALSVIGIVSEKRTTKNKNVFITLEDLTGSAKVLVRFENQELFKKAEEVLEDDIIGIRASGNRDILFAHDIFFPDAFLPQKTKFSEDISIAFISDIHAGGGKHLGKNFEKFIEWLNSKNEIAKKIKYLFIAGDNIDGVGVFPGQEFLIELKSVKEQYSLLANYLKKIPKRITIFMCPGQHDAVRLAEPQPIIGKKYAPELYEIENLVLVTNPALIKLFEGDKEFKVLMYHGDSIHDFISSIPELREMKAHKCPAKAVKYMLKKRHLAPFHGRAVYIPGSEVDPLVISEVPDVFCTGEVHRCDIDVYNGVLIITGGCWQSRTAHEEKVGNEPDPGKVPILNLKTRELKIIDFFQDSGVEDEYK